MLLPKRFTFRLSLVLVRTLAGAMFFLPALYIWNVTDVTLYKMAIPIILVAYFGVLLCVMFRRYFVEEMHYVYPFPSGRAAAEVLMSNEGSKAKLMLGSGLSPCI